VSYDPIGHMDTEPEPKPMDLGSYECQVCHETYGKTRGDDEALAEMLEEHPWADPKDVGLTCDDCYNEVKGWWDGLTTDAKRAVRDAHPEGAGPTL
jgi:hypothetical protein